VQQYSGSPWLTGILKLEVVRQASIPSFTDPITGSRYTPLQCVARVRNFELLSERPKDNRLPVRVDLDVHGVGRWRRDLSIYVPSQEQIDERAKIAAQRSPIVMVHKSLKELHPSFYAEPDGHSEVFEGPEPNALPSEPVGEPRIWETPEYTTESHDPLHSLTESGEFGSPAQPAVERGIRRLPPIAQAKVEEVRARAELQYRSDAQNPNKNMDEPVAEYVCTVFWAYLAQACAAASEEGWTAEELRRYVEAQLRNGIESGFASKHPVGLNPAIADSKAANFASYEPSLRAYMRTAKDMEASFRADLMNTITNNPAWEDYLNQLQTIAASELNRSQQTCNLNSQNSDNVPEKLAVQSGQRKRGRPPIAEELKQKALASEGGGKARAQILYGRRHPTTQQVKNASTILRYYKRTNGRVSPPVT
jgi:hypothetical protein